MKSVKITAILLIAVMAAGLLAGCGGQLSPPPSPSPDISPSPLPDPSPFIVEEQEPAATEAPDSGNSNDFEYEINNAGVTIMYYKGSDAVVEIPSEIESKPVTSICEYAFSGCTELTDITIPDGVTSIDDCTFYGCTGLTDIRIPNGVASIGKQAFAGCTGLISITIPDSVTSIDVGAFRRCTGLTDVTIPESVTSIGNQAFFGCTGLTNITVPDSVTSIGVGNYATLKEGLSVIIWNGAFGDCTGLEKAVYKGKSYPLEIVGQWTNGREQYDLPEEFYNAINGT
ncbi:MAG: leucine-rich repeat domain-containing protein [Oscillospiraceae bacterium]|jgi:hypothetical protein|nr:leucine-rich repeat domain-containing protein [Oscillospiraceae bacterium]